MAKSAEDWIKSMSEETLAEARKMYPQVFGVCDPVNGIRVKPVKTVNRLTWKDEDEFMRAVFDHLEVMAVEQPLFALAYHPANENSHRRPGIVAGIPDIHLPIARGKSIGLWVELKVGDGKVSPTQREIIYKLRSAGHAVFVVWDDLDEVKEIFNNYDRS